MRPRPTARCGPGATMRWDSWARAPTTLAVHGTPLQVLAGSCAAPGPCGASAYLTGIVAVSAGRSDVQALRSDGTVWAWGKGVYGELGNDLYAEADSPAQMSLTAHWERQSLERFPQPAQPTARTRASR